MGGNKKRGTTEMSTERAAKFQVPCKYYKYGTCRMGTLCRFQHLEEDHPSRHPELSRKQKGGAKLPQKTGANTNSGTLSPSKHTMRQKGLSPPLSFAQVAAKAWTKAPVASQTSKHQRHPHHASPPKASLAHANGSEKKQLISDDEASQLQSLGIGQLVRKFDRKPFAHVVLVAAAGSHVAEYGARVEEALFSHSIDVYLQSSTANGRPVKAEHLSQIIAGSKAEFLVVITERNMVRGTCQAKGGGKMTEVPVGTLLLHIWRDAASQSDAAERAMATKRDLTKDQEYELLGRVAGVHHIKERLQRLRQDILELASLRSGSGQYVSEEKMASKLTRSQKSTIRFHKQVAAAQSHLRRLSGISQRAKEGGIRGHRQAADYGPSKLCRIIPKNMATVLQRTVAELLVAICGVGDELLTFGAPLWQGYLAGVTEKRPEASAGSDRGWTCGACTLDNEAHALACTVCESPRGNHRGWTVQGEEEKKTKKSRSFFGAQVGAEEYERMEEERLRQKIRKEQEEMRLKKQWELEQLNTRQASSGFPRGQQHSPSASLQIRRPAGKVQSAPLSYERQAAGSWDKPSYRSPWNTSPPVGPSLSPGRQATAPGYGQVGQDPSASRMVAHSTRSSPRSYGQGSPLGGFLSDYDQRGQELLPPISQMSLSTSPSSYARGSNSVGAFPGQAEYMEVRQRTPGYGKFMQQGFGNIWSTQYTQQPASRDPWASPPTSYSISPPTPYASSPVSPPMVPSYSSGPESFSSLRPCCVCGAESAIACPPCSQTGTETFFCSAEHQNIVWEDHIAQHRR